MGNDNLMKSGIIGEFWVWISNKIKNQVRLANRQVGVVPLVSAPSDVALVDEIGGPDFRLRMSNSDAAVAKYSSNSLPVT